MFSSEKNYISGLSIALILFIVIALGNNLKLWQKENKIIHWDIVSYYAYLPATFIYNDITLSFTKKDNSNEKRKYIIWPHETENGALYIKTTMGLSFIYAPFFFMGHIYALNSDYDAGGFSAPYKVALIIGAIFWLFLGLLYLRKTLLLFFSDVVTSITILTIGLGTNLFYYSSMEPAMPHLYNFSLFSIFIWYTIQWYKSPKVSISIKLGLLIGLITLIRPTNVIISLFFLLYDVNTLEDIKTRFLYFLNKYRYILIISFFGFIVIIPQLIYWKYITDHWVYFSYGDEERFFWTNPQLLKGLFSYRKGWLIYTPVMVFSVVGLAFLRNKYKKFRLAIITFFLLNIYIIFSWWSWWYGGSFGLRAMIDSYALLAIPLAAMFHYFNKRKLYFKSILFSIVILLNLYSIFNTSQYHYGAIHYDGMTKEAYWNSFGRLRPSGEFYNLIKQPDYDEARRGEYDE